MNSARSAVARRGAGRGGRAVRLPARPERDAGRRRRSRCRAPPTASPICPASGSPAASRCSSARRRPRASGRPTTPRAVRRRRRASRRPTSRRPRPGGSSTSPAAASTIRWPAACSRGVPRITVRPLPFEIVQLRDRVHHPLRDPPRVPHHPDRRAAAPRRPRAVVSGRLGGALGGRHAGGGRHRLQRQDLAGRRRHDSQREAARDRALPPRHLRHHRLRRDDGGPGGLHEAVAAAGDVPAAAERAIREYECIENNEDIVRFEKLLETEFKK